MTSEDLLNTRINELKNSLFKLNELLNTGKDDFYRLRTFVDEIVKITINEVEFFEKCNFLITSELAKAVMKLDNLRRIFEPNRDTIHDLANDTTNYLSLEMKLFKILCNVFLIELTSNNVIERKLPTFEQLANYKESNWNLDYTHDLTGEEDFFEISPVIPFNSLYKLVLRSIIYLSNIFSNWESTNSDVYESIVDMKLIIMRQLFLFLVYIDRFANSSNFNDASEGIKKLTSSNLFLGYKILNQVFFNGINEVKLNLESLPFLIHNKYALGYINEISKVYCIIFHDFDLTIFEKQINSNNVLTIENVYTPVFLDESNMNYLFSPKECKLDCFQLQKHKPINLAIAFKQVWEMIMLAFGISSSSTIDNNGVGFKFEGSLTLKSLHTISGLMGLLLQFPKSILQNLDIETKEEIISDLLTILRIKLKEFLITYKLKKTNSKKSSNTTFHKDLNLLLSTLQHFCSDSSNSNESKSMLNIIRSSLITTKTGTNDFGDLFNTSVHFIKLYHNRNKSLDYANDDGDDDEDYDDYTLPNKFNTAKFNETLVVNGDKTTSDLLLGIIWSCLLENPEEFYKKVSIEIGRPFALGQNSDSLVGFLVDSSRKVIKENNNNSKLTPSVKTPQLPRPQLSRRSTSLDISMLRSGSDSGKSSGGTSRNVNNYGVVESSDSSDGSITDSEGSCCYSDSDCESYSGTFQEAENEIQRDAEYVYNSPSSSKSKRLKKTSKSKLKDKLVEQEGEDSKRIEEAENILRMMTRLDISNYGTSAEGISNNINNNTNNEKTDIVRSKESISSPLNSISEGKVTTIEQNEQNDINSKAKDEILLFSTPSPSSIELQNPELAVPKTSPMGLNTSNDTDNGTVTATGTAVSNGHLHGFKLKRNSIINKLKSPFGKKKNMNM